MKLTARMPNLCSRTYDSIRKIRITCWGLFKLALGKTDPGLRSPNSCFIKLGSQLQVLKFLSYSLGRQLLRYFTKLIPQPFWDCNGTVHSYNGFSSFSFVTWHQCVQNPQVFTSRLARGVKVRSLTNTHGSVTASRPKALVVTRGGVQDTTIIPDSFFGSVPHLHWLKLDIPISFAWFHFRRTWRSWPYVMRSWNHCSMLALSLRFRPLMHVANVPILWKGD